MSVIDISRFNSAQKTRLFQLIKIMRKESEDLHTPMITASNYDSYKSQLLIDYYNIFHDNEISQNRFTIPRKHFDLSVYERVRIREKIDNPRWKRIQTSLLYKTDNEDNEDVIILRDELLNAKTYYDVHNARINFLKAVKRRLDDEQQLPEVDTDHEIARLKDKIRKLENKISELEVLNASIEYILNEREEEDRGQRNRR